ncbi:uncharacterized protein TRIADDRAFT_54650 [Trichoplax adhaerens]|uniref:Transporter n=1 Tax=Trichoplax adhaerens TaxID=10228 RepID=B3RSM1_TRIAD|nr:hypothetical protein TRIADDRAFT_54650 [Trichoplax adhaerens]EDV26538.1 hypothetical protein TRIADDRAFT_54650 [Trichoplax adhaerens]|eukprot:XP_002110534.1 hypothetical protein TRIADDRAFT_54650 [Trichoplax adhaerens]
MESKSISQLPHKSFSSSWGRYEFICSYQLSLIVFYFSVSQIWKLPFIAYLNGRVAFFVPYILVLIVVILPGSYLEMLMGQIAKKGTIQSWNKLMPIWKGLGYVQVMMLIVSAIFMAPLTGYALYYFMVALITKPRSNPPWNSCSNSWNTQYCRTTYQFCSRNIIENSSSLHTALPTTTTASYQNCINPGQLVRMPELEYWYFQVLNINSSGIGGIVPWQVVCLCTAWGLVAITIFLGLSSFRRVAYVIFSLSVAAIAILLVVALSLPASPNAKFQFFNESSILPLSRPATWAAALAEAIFSFSIASGCLAHLGSRNKANTNHLWHSLISIIAIAMFALASCQMVITFVSYIASQLNVPITQVITLGVNLAYVAFPTLSRLTVTGRVTLIVFYALIILVCISKMAIFTEVAFDAIFEEIPDGYLKRYKVLWRIGFIAVLNCIGLIYTTRGGLRFIEATDEAVALVQTLLIIFQYAGLAFLFSWVFFGISLAIFIGFIIYQVFYKYRQNKIGAITPHGNLNMDVGFIHYMSMNVDSVLDSAETYHLKLVYSDTASKI